MLDQPFPAASQPTESALFEIISTSPDFHVWYSFTVDGTVERAAGRDGVTSIDEANDSITTLSDGTILVEGKTGLTKGDAYLISGAIVNFSQTDGQSGYRLYLDGVEVTSDPTGPVIPQDPPAIPEPEADTCQAHISAAQDYAAAVRGYEGLSCEVGVVEMVCPIAGEGGQNVTYPAKNGCEVEALRSYGWEVPQEPGPGFPEIDVRSLLGWAFLGAGTLSYLFRA